MNGKVEHSTVKDTKFNAFLWLLMIALLGMAIAADTYFRRQLWVLRLFAWVIVALIEAYIGYQTSQGRRLWLFAQEAQVEWRMVIWPTRPETLQTTLVVVVVVVIAGFFLWGVDSILLWLIAFFTGHRG